MALKPSLREVLTRLREQGLVTPDAEPQAMTAMEAHWRSAPASPWFVRALAGFGAWMAALFLLFFFGMLLGLRDEGVIFFLGLVLCAGTTGLRRASEQIFLSQLSLAFCLAGQGLFLFGLVELTESVTATALGVLLLELALLFLYPDQILRFLATLGAMAALSILVYQPRVLLLMDLLLVAVAALLHFLLLHQARFQQGRWRELLPPVTYALIIALLAPLLSRGYLHFGLEFLERLPAPIGLLTIGLAMVTLYTAARMLREVSIEVSEAAGATVFAALTLLTLLTLSTPGVIAAAGILGLAFHRRSVVMLGLTVAFLISFGVLYYYDLSLSLLAKSGALLGSGLVLLGLRLFLSRRFPAATPEVP